MYQQLTIRKADPTEQESCRLLLPDEILQYVLSFLDWRSLIRSARVARQYYQISRELAMQRATAYFETQSIFSPYARLEQWIHSCDPRDQVLDGFPVLSENQEEQVRRLQLLWPGRTCRLGLLLLVKALAITWQSYKPEQRELLKHLQATDGALAIYRRPSATCPFRDMTLAQITELLSHLINILLFEEYLNLLQTKPPLCRAQQAHQTAQQQCEIIIQLLTACLQNKEMNILAGPPSSNQAVELLGRLQFVLSAVSLEKIIYDPKFCKQITKLHQEIISPSAAPRAWPAIAQSFAAMYGGVMVPHTMWNP